MPPVPSQLIATKSPAQPQTKPKRVSLVPAAPATVQALAEANQLGCECPLPPPTDIDPSYLPPAVEAWLEGLEEDCPELRDRNTSLDCSEWPCLLSVEIAEKGEWKRENLAQTLTCGKEGPNLIYKGNVGGPGGVSLLFSIRPEEQADYGYREMIRATAMMPTEQGGEIIIP